MAELAKGLGEPVKDLSEDLYCKRGARIRDLSGALSRSKGEACLGQGEAQRAELGFKAAQGMLLFTTCIPWDARRLTGVP